MSGAEPSTTLHTCHGHMVPTSLLHEPAVNGPRYLMRVVRHDFGPLFESTSIPVNFLLWPLQLDTVGLIPRCPVSVANIVWRVILHHLSSYAFCGTADIAHSFMTHAALHAHTIFVPCSIVPTRYARTRAWKRRAVPVIGKNAIPLLQHIIMSTLTNA